MTALRKRPVIIIVLIGMAAGLSTYAYVRNRPVTLRGAVIRAGDDPNKQVPIAGVDVVASDGTRQAETKSTATGAFGLTVRRSLVRRQSLTLTFEHPGYEPLKIVNPLENRLYVARLLEIPPKIQAPDRETEPVSAVSIRYTVKTPSTIDIGPAVKTFEIANKANVPCRGDPVCSPDGKWKAASGTASLDAGPDNEFRNARVSCIAGPCPFTAISHDGFSHGGHTIGVTVLNWSDTVTFLMQAEAVRNVLSESVRKTYPVIFDHTMSFSIPGSAQGTCIEAELDGNPIVFPIDPDLSLSWVQCDAQPDAEGSKLFRCDLKPGYVFR
jgi:hypothetical protein